MDYQGNYFPAEPDENQSKAYRIVKGIFKWTMYGISFLIYALIFYILFINRDSKVLEKNHMHMIPQYESINTKDAELYRINTKVFMNDDGSLQLHNIDYSNEFGLLEVGIKYNAKKLTNNIRNDAFRLVLTDTSGKEYVIANNIEENRGRYGFIRVVFSDLNIDLDSNDLRYDAEHPTEVRTNEIYTLSVYNNSNDSLIYEFIVYDNTTTFNRTDYEA